MFEEGIRKRGQIGPPNNPKKGIDFRACKSTMTPRWPLKFRPAYSITSYQFKITD